jgi:hypothetical protein
MINKSLIWNEIFSVRKLITENDIIFKMYIISLLVMVIKILNLRKFSARVFPKFSEIYKFWIFFKKYFFSKKFGYYIFF